MSEAISGAASEEPACRFAHAGYLLEIAMEPRKWSHDRKHFYKYMTADVAKLVLQNNSLRWALPTSFNDPFDVQFDLRVEFDRDRVIDRALQNVVDLYMGRRHVPKGNPFADRIRWLQRTAPGLNEADLRNRFQQAMSAGMDNAQKHMPARHEEIRAVLAPLKLLCLSEVPDNILMWAHYAKDHAGAVMEVSVIEKYDSAWGAAKPVRYEKEMPFLVDEERLVRVLSGEGTIATPELFEEAVFVKAIDWEYEKEWRLVGGWEKEKTEEFIPFYPEELTAVYLGCRMSEKDKKEIKELAIKKYGHATIYEGTKSTQRFAVEFSKT
jgi:Protein of unknown function (DUF2971)